MDPFSLAFGIVGLFVGYSAITDSVDIQINEEKAVRAFLNDPNVSRLVAELRAEVNEFGQDRRRLVESVTRGIESIASDSARLTDASCILLYCVSGVVVLTGAMWAYKTYSQSLREQLNKIKGPVFASRLVELSALIVEDLEKVVLNQPHASKLANELPVTRGMESGVSDSTRPTDVLCFIILCITPIFIWLGVVWARRLYSQLFRKHWQANRIQDLSITAVTGIIIWLGVVWHAKRRVKESHLQTLVSSSQVLNHWHRRAEERRMSEVHRVVETIMGEIEIVTSNSARLTDALCFMFFSLTVITVVLGVLWASKLYSQTLWERAKIKEESDP